MDRLDCSCGLVISPELRALPIRYRSTFFTLAAYGPRLGVSPWARNAMPARAAMHVG